jgi:cytidylate kinase
VIIALDGPAGSGKSTIAREVAKCLGLRYLDTGAMYRTITLLALEQGLVPERISEAGPLAARTTIRFQERPDDLSRVFVGDREVTDDIRSPLVTKNVSAVSADAGVRAVLTEMQRVEAAAGDVVLEGRDMGTVVCPQADLKIYLTASVEERARRRQLQLGAQGVVQSLEQLMADIEARDAYDSGRELAPLRKADDAVEIDTTGMTIEQVIATVCAHACARKDASTGAPDAYGPKARGTAGTLHTHPAKWPVSRMVRSPLDRLLYRVAYSFIPPLWKALFRMDIKGVEHIPLHGPVLLASNHRSNLDPFFLGVSFPRQIHFMAKAELWKVKTLGRVIEILGSFPVSRGSADRQAVRRAIEFLDAGAVVGMFPEGHRQRDGGFGPINPGFALFALREGVTTIPVVMEGTERVFRGGLPRFPRVRVTFGRPLPTPPPSGNKAQRAAMMTQSLEGSFLALAGGSAVSE